ncbi:hypothetical protein MUB23_04330 [Cuneatibacter sp. NSJ-177]|uniref:class I fructose-bisphosphate aldolase n=1 Tax=Cuneatibacter sp. NSJ-177 TaxID=2931401 RepID=UPI001FD025FA|nr:hypothetical protein [Cuneatibacter sp. NSJ-177]MCJ7834622.1 hypothetical protein [Cuneatibacter sp. NSJ-177]
MKYDKKPAVGRILGKDGRVVMLAMDHARMNGIFRGLEDPVPAMEAAIEGGADAIMTSYGVMKHYRSLLDGNLAKVLRMDTGATRFRDDWEQFREWHQVYQVEDALRIGADAVISYGFPGIGVDAETLRIIGGLAAASDRYGLVSIAEMHACPSPGVADPYEPEVVASEARIASEFGADLVKTDYTGSVESFQTVTKACPVPIIIAGGKKCATPRDTFVMMQDALKAGAAGCVFGRQIWQDPCPLGMTKGLVALVHHGAGVEEAVEIYRETCGR